MLEINQERIDRLLGVAQVDLTKQYATWLRNRLVVHDEVALFERDEDKFSLAYPSRSGMFVGNVEELLGTAKFINTFPAPTDFSYWHAWVQGFGTFKAYFVAFPVDCSSAPLVRRIYEIEGEEE